MSSEGDDVEIIPDYSEIARFYAEAVASQRLPTNHLLVLAAQRYLRMLEMAAEPNSLFVYSPLHVVDYCRFAERLSHFEAGLWELTQIAPGGEPDPSIILEPWQIWIESAVQGFRRRSTNERLVGTALEVSPRKNAKSLRLSIAALYDLCCSGVMAPEISVAAASERQADRTLFGDIIKMVHNEPDLVENYQLSYTQQEIRRGDGAIFKLTSKGERQDGLNPSLALFEEGHAGAASVFKVVDSAFGSRPSQQRRMITTAGVRPEGPGWELLREAIMILENGVEDYTFFAAVYTLDRELYIDKVTNAIDWDKLLNDETLVERANPMIDVSLDRLKIKSDMVKAKRRPDLRGEVARTRFNIWTGSGATLIEPAQWAALYRKIDLRDFVGQKCWIGVDLAQVLDMCAIALVFEMPGDVIAVFAEYFMPAESPTTQDEELVDQFMAWADEEDGKWLTLTPGTLADHDLVRERVETFYNIFDVQMIACDPAQAHNTVKHLWDGNKPVKVYPNSAATMTGTTDDILGRIAAGTIIHDGNPVLNWNVQNVQGERKGNGSIMPRKDAPNSKRKIDGFVALCFANGCRITPDNAKDADKELPRFDPYAHRGIIGYAEMTNAK